MVNCYTMFTKSFGGLMKKLFVSDVDGTLVTADKPHLSRELKSAIKLTVDNGDLFVLCSGRPTSNLIELSKELYEENIKVEYVAGFNGVEIFDLIKGQIIVDNSLSCADIEQITIACDSLNLDYLYFDSDCIRTNMPDNYWAIRESGFYGHPVSADTTACKSPKVLLVVEEAENYQIQSQLKELLPDFDIFESAPHFIEIVKKDINKASVVKQIMELENINHDHTYGFGDSGNDVELLNYAKTAVVVANGNPKAKASADILIGDASDNAVADYLFSVYE